MTGTHDDTQQEHGYIHDDYRPSLLNRGIVDTNGGTGNGHTLGRLTGKRVLGVAVTPDSAAVGKPIATGNVARLGKVVAQVALSPEASPGDQGGNPDRQAEAIRKHSRRLVRAMARARDSEHREVLQEMLDRNYRRLCALQADHLAKHEAGKKSVFDPLTPMPKAPMYLLPRGSVPRGFNSKGR